MPRKIDICGQTFGRLTVKAEGPRRGARRSVYCRCACGSDGLFDPRSLLSGKTKSCGCYQRDVVAAACLQHTTHGRSKSAEYNIWQKMKARCGNPNDAKYPIYGGRGIEVCEAWSDSFESFLLDMGPRPTSKHSIDRKRVDGNYEPGNCRWATPKEQARNKRSHRLVLYLGVEMPLSEACELAGVNYRSALWRLNCGKPWQPLPPPPSTKGEPT